MGHSIRLSTAGLRARTGWCTYGADSPKGEREEIVFPAEWDKYGVSAGPIRNQKMIDEGKPDLVFAFPGGRGTTDMIRRAAVAGIRVVRAMQ